MSSGRGGGGCPQDNILCCPICMDIYKSPRMLPCQHTLCETCLHSYIVNKSRERVLVSDFPCPVCRVSTPAPRAFTRIDTWASLFPLNHLLVSLLDSSFQDMLDRSETGSNSSLPSERCSEHGGKPIEFFCTEHNSKLCSKCFKNAHRQCEVLDIEEHVEFTLRFNTVKSDVENVLGYLIEAITKLKSNIDLLCLQKTTILNEVKELRGKVEALFNSIEIEIKDHVNVQHDGEIVVLKAQCEKYERIKAEISASETTLKELPISGNIGHSLEKITVVENEIKSQLAFIQSCHANIKQIKLEFAIDNQLLSFLNSFSQIGTINANYFDSNVQDPPELQSRGCTLNESFVPSRDISTTSEDLQPSSPLSRHVSPRAIFIARPPATISAVTDGESQGASSQMETLTQPRQPKEPKRPKTVPIESTAPTPVVRPRPERPEVKGMIPHFLPRSCSSPIGHTPSVGPSNTDVPGRYIVNTTQELLPNGSNYPDEHRGHSSGFPAILVTGIANSPSISGKPPVTEKPKHRSWQYVNMVTSPGEHSTARRNSESGETSEDATVARSLFRSRSSSASNSKEEKSNVSSGAASSTIDDKFATSVSAATVSFNQLIRSFQSKANTQMKESENSPVYENSLLASCASTPTGEKSFSFCAAPNASEARIPKHCTRMKDIAIRIECDVRECTITGSVEIADSRLILIDCNNSKVKLFDTDLTYAAHLDMAKEPWNVTTISSNEIAVTVPLEKTIHVIRVATSCMSTLRCIATKRECWGITYLDRKFITTTKDDGNQVAFLDGNGRELQIVNFSSRENPNILRPVSLSPSKNGNFLYVCCEGQSGTKGSIVSMSIGGDVLNVYTFKELDRPYSAAIDPYNDNVYVTAIRSANVLALTEGGSSVKTLLSRDVGLTRPQHIHVTSWDDKTVLILTERRSDRANVYCMN
ncbi:uncharacterized protein LOC128244813 [Mya arenaria]|nr:uncharacterized protein LOC128244813 [Mya arenaria]